MKTVQDYLDLGLVFVVGDKICGTTGDSSSGDLDIFKGTICAKKYSEGAAKIGVDCYARARWTPSSFAWRNNDGVKPEYKGLIHAMFENGVIIQDFAKSLNWGSSFKPVIQWRPTVLKSGDVHENNDAYSTLPIGIDSPELREAFKLFNEYMESNPKFKIKEEHPSRTATVNIEGHDYLLVSHAPTLSPKADKPMKPVYTAETHAKGELPPVGSGFYPIENEKNTQTCLGYTSKGKVVGECLGGGVVSLFFVNEIKPIIKTIKVNGFDVPAPMSEAVEYGKSVFISAPSESSLYSQKTWQDTGYHYKLLQRGLCHPTKSAAIAHAKAMLGIDPNA